MKFVILFPYLLSLFPLIYSKNGAKHNNIQPHYSTEDARLNFTQLANKYCNSVEEYDVITEDGYILTIFHVIPEKKLKDTPMLLQHGILDSADTFIIRGNKSLVRTLTSAGYDVWVGNFRGNKYGRRHLKLKPDQDAAFWDYTFHEIGIFDASAIVRHILKETGKKNINVIGHSLGNTVFYVLGSMRPEYNEKINLMIALAPIAFLSHVKPPLTDGIDSAEMVNNFLIVTGQEEIPPANPVLQILQKIICTELKYSYDICGRGLLLALSGTDVEQLDRGFFSILMGHYPQPHSRKGLVHLAQIAKQKKFLQYDYGGIKNLALYKSVNPAAYNLSKVTMRVTLYAAKNDKVSTLEDVMLLKKKLPNVATLFILKPKKWNHIDWVWGLEVDKYFYPHLFSFLDNNLI